MKKPLFVALLMTLMIGICATPSLADRYQRRQSDNPFRLVGYALHPVGLALEYAVMRPVHWFVSQPTMDVVFGHQPSMSEDGTYFEWGHGDYSPSIAEERAAVAPPKPKKAEKKTEKKEEKKEMKKEEEKKDDKE